MRFVNELVPLRLYSNKRKVYIPINERDKKHGAAIFLMGTTQEQNEKMMNAPFLYNPNNAFRAYYIDRNMMAYVNSDAANSVEEEEFDEVQEAVLSEGMIHEKKVRFQYEGSSTMDERIANMYYNKDSIKYILLMTRMKECPLDKIIVHFYPTTDTLQKSCPYEMDKHKVYSYTYKNQIHLLSYTSYDARSMDGPYDLYLKAELINCLIQAKYPTISKKIAICTSMALSGQVEWLREKKGKEQFKYYESEEEGISGLYMADLILQLYKTKGSYGIKRFLDGDVGALANIAGNRVIAATRKLFESSLMEANLSTKERNNLKDSDFGIPSKRKYPMPDAAHVKAAIRMFNHCDSEDEAELARRIKAKMKQFGVTDVEIGEKNRLSKYIHSPKKTNESASIEPYESDVPGVEYADNSEIFAGNYPEEYYDVLTIVKDFSKEEFDRISFNSTYKNSPWIKKRIILRDQNDYPMSFMDVYHFPSDPERAQITTAVGRSYRGNHLCSIMFQQLLDSGFAEENGIKKYIWHVHPDNEASEKIAIKAGFKKSSDKLDKYGRYTYVYNMKPESIDANAISLPSISTESMLQISESAAFILNEADAKNDLKFKRFLYNERLKNARAVMTIYDQVKQRNPSIDRTFRELKLYRGLNVYVDTSYYHGLYLKNAFKGNKRAFYMYFDFVSRLMDNEDILNDYKKVTYFFPVQFTRDGQSVDDLFDFNNNLNPISLIAYLIRRDPDVLKRWSNKDILFIGDGGYFRVNFKNFVLKDFNRFKKNIERLLTTRQIIDNEVDDNDPMEPASTTSAIAAEVIDKIETDGKINISNIAPISNIKIHHLTYEEDLPELVDKKSSNAIMILAKDSSSVISTISTKGIASKDIKSYYKPKV